MRQSGATPHRGARASHYRVLSCCGAQVPDAQAQQLWLMGPVPPRHVGSSQTRPRTRFPGIGRQILNHCTTMEAPILIFAVQCHLSVDEVMASNILRLDPWFYGFSTQWYHKLHDLGQAHQLFQDFIIHIQKENGNIFLEFYLFIYLFSAGSYYLSSLYILVYTCQSQSPNASHHHPQPPSTFSPQCPYIWSLHLCLYFCLANRFICTIFVDSIHMC